MLYIYLDISEGSISKEIFSKAHDSQGVISFLFQRPQKYLDERKLDEKLFSVAKYYANPDVIFQDVADDLNDLVIVFVLIL